MKNNWQTKKLGEVSEYIGRGISPTYISTSGIVVLNQKCVRDHRVNYAEARLHDNHTKKVSSEKLLQLGDVLVNSTGVGTLGRVAQVKKIIAETTVDSHITIVRPIKGMFDNDFFGYVMIYVEDYLKKLGEGASGQIELPRAKLRDDFIITFSNSLAEQKRIVKILDEVFEKIEKAKENAEKNLQNSKELFETYLNNIFMNQSSNWEEKKLNDVYDVRDGTHDSPKYKTSGFPLITSKNLKNGVLSFNHVNYISENDYLNINKRSKVDKGDVLFAMIGTIGIPTVIEEEPKFAIKNVALFKVPNNQSSHFLKYYLRSKLVIDKMQKEAKGTTQKFVGLAYLRDFRILLPNLSEQERVVKKLDELSEQTKKLEVIYRQKIANLEELKKSVLQKAFSGEL